MRPYVITYMSLIMCTTASLASEYSGIGNIRAAEEHIRGQIAELAEREQEFADDPEALLGLATLYERYATSPEYYAKSGDLFRKVVALQPTNNAAWASLARHATVEFLARRQRVLQALDWKQEYASREDLQEVEIPSWGGELYDWLREDGQDRVVVKDFDEARARLRQKLERDLPGVQAVLDQGERNDPDNALYDYLRASLSFELGDDAGALSRIDQGAKKARLENYRHETSGARKKVLLAIEFPDGQRRVLEERRALAGVFVDTRKVLEIAKGYEAGHDLNRAMQTYEILLEYASQLRRERMPGRPDDKRGNNAISERIERKANQAIERIRAELRRSGTP